MTSSPITVIRQNRCVIGEGPVWNAADEKLYFVNARGQNEICTYAPETGIISARAYDEGTSAIAFSKDGGMLVSRRNGAFYLNEDGSTSPLYDCEKYDLRYCNDAKVGPDGRFYVGTQSEKRVKVSDKINGRLYSIDKDGNVRILLEGLILSNGMEWSIDEKFFYHTDSDTKTIKEYAYDPTTPSLTFTGRQITVPGVDGFTIDEKDQLYVACWGKGHIAVVDTKTMEIIDHIPVPAQIPASCGFAGENMDQLVVTTANWNSDLAQDPNAGFTFIHDTDTQGRPPFLFG
jgi:sugar lactone lactonase YvrE